MNKVAAFALRRKNSILSMSEKLFCPPQPLRLVWITPAYAGKRQARPGQVGRLLDHPRVCGEKTFAVWENVPGAGSPPRVRGKAGLSHGCLVLVGITPARAGKSFQEHGYVIGVWDHPRMCGEKLLICANGGLNPGSPPHVRGKVEPQTVKLFAVGITPACAGKRS